MSDRWYNVGRGPMEFDGAPFMQTVDQAGIGVAAYLESLPRPATRFQQTEEALFTQELHVPTSLDTAKVIQAEFDIGVRDFSEDDLRAACAELDEANRDFHGGDHIINMFGGRYIASLGGYGIQASVMPAAVYLRVSDASVSGETASLKRVLRVPEPIRVPVSSVESIWPYER